MSFFRTYILFIMTSKAKIKSFPPCSPPNCLLVNNLSIHNLPRTRLYVIHSAYPFQRIVCLKLLRDSLCLFHLLYDPFKSFLSLFLYVCQITVQSATHEQINIYIPVVFLQIPQMSLSPYTNKSRFFFLRQSKAGDKIIPLSDISTAHFFKNCFLHNLFHLSYRSMSLDFFFVRFGCCLPSC